ncbi:MAG TPA: NUMOD1 domain-containing DNA-binding protein [Candidatus Nanoarchaeia archaeon]|nr:NUMOD1 domain-containing DNA-binding protein [Candidatus Nanoarchaeia archaeon]
MDGDKNNNSVANLEWNTGSENVIRSYNKLNRKGSQTGRTGRLSPVSKRIVQMDLQGNELKIWDSMIEAAKFFGIKRQTITSCASGKSKTAAKHKWKFYE